MRISVKAEYACLAVVELARTEGDRSPKRIHDIAVAQKIPEPYLTKILLQLKTAGLVQSARGSIGGYQLARRSSEISVAAVIAAIDGCSRPLCKGDSFEASQLFELLARADAAEWDILESTTIAHLAGIAAIHDWVV
jgi:Rrf2 family cysteine metabolism transcriptional repressor